MPDLTIPERAIAAAADAMLREPVMHTVESSAEMVLRDAAPIVVAAELRDLAAQWHTTREEWREEDGRSVRSSGLGYAVTAALDLADSLDPEGANRG